VPERTDQIDLSIELTEVDLTPVEMDCMRCREAAPMRFAGMCTACRDALYEKYAGGGSAVEVETYDPKMHVTPNAVALKDD
jgi:hypothetical protein